MIAGNQNAYSQPPTGGLMLTWNQSVGCQEIEFDKDREIYAEDINDSECVRFCENSNVTFNLVNLQPGSTVTWNATGGSLSNITNTSCQIGWTDSGSGSISFTITNGSTVFTKTLCVEKIVRPFAYFEIAGSNNQMPFLTCSNQLINFQNLSTANLGGGIISYLWDFGDGTTSTAFEPSHIYQEDGNYIVQLNVTNSCYCVSSYRIEVKAERKGFEISCPTVICEGDTEIYSLPFDGSEVCQDNYNWSVIGGTILSQAGGNVEIRWDSVDSTGFGYITFDPSECNVDCRQITTAKVPVIQANGTIEGPSTICFGEQARYKLPQWPTTAITWQIVGNDANSLAEILLTDQRNEIIIKPNSAETLTLRATYMNTLLNCGGQAEIIIKVKKPLTIEGEQKVCQNETATFTLSENATQTSWTLNNNNGSQIAIGYGAQFSYLFSNAGNYVLNINNPDYCDPKSFPFQVLPQPQKPTGIEGDLFVCPNATYSYQVESPNPAYDYVWEVSGGTIQGSNIGEQVNINFDGTFPVTISVKQQTVLPVACESLPYTIIVNEINVPATISSAFGNVCSNSISTYEAIDTNSLLPFEDGDTYHWALSDPLIGSISDGQGTNAIEINWNNITVSTTVDLILTIGKCTVSPQFIKTITLKPQTQIEIITNSNPACSFTPVTFEVQAINGATLGASDVIEWTNGSTVFTGAPGVFTFTTQFPNNSNQLMDKIISARIVSSSDCASSTVVSYVMSVYPNPQPTATLSSNSNSFCELSSVNATIVASTGNTSTIQWFKDNVEIIGANGTTLQVDSSLGFGEYKYQVINSNNCTRFSNPILISQFCSNGQSCESPNETVTNTSFLSSCGTITLVGSHTGTPLSSTWNILGAGQNSYTITGNQLTGLPGVYKTIYRARYECEDDENGAGLAAVKDVVIPYLADFSYSITCSSNDTFNINLIDNSTIFSGLDSYLIQFYYKQAGASAFSGPLAYNPSFSVPEIANLPSGAYDIKIEITGVYNGVNMPVCSQEQTVTIQGVSSLLSIDFQTPKCFDSSVNFNIFGFISNDLTFFWDFGDGSTSTLEAPSKVFTTSTLQQVSCTVSNSFGCSRTFTSEEFLVPQECFFGELVATPNNGSVCEGELITLKYQTNNDNCEVVQYIWMNGNTPIPGLPNNLAEIQVGNTGFYWVTVINQDGCRYNSNQIQPVFNKLPTLRYKGESTFCEDTDMILEVSTNANTIQWYVNNQLYTQFNNNAIADFTSLLSTGTYDLTVVATNSSGCSQVINETLTIIEQIQSISFSYNVRCEPNYLIEVSAVASNGENVVYNWSNGETGSVIYVTDGGPYKVTASAGGCSFSSEIDLPKNPENFLWVFPSGCFQDCSDFKNFIIGNTGIFQQWSWNFNDNPEISGGNSVAGNYDLGTDGSYSLTLANGGCRVTSAPLQFISSKCDACEIKEFEVKDIKTNDTPYCSYTYTLNIQNGFTEELNVTLSVNGNNFILIPSSFVLQPGANSIDVIVIPQNDGFTDVNIIWHLLGTIVKEDRYYYCANQFETVIPTCNGIAFSEKTITQTFKDDASFSAYPNPAKELLHVKYPKSTTAVDIGLYDLFGRKLVQKSTNTTTDAITFDTGAYAKGMYLLVVMDKNTILWQQKVIID